jgi:hypothetical protein
LEQKKELHIKNEEKSNRSKTKGLTLDGNINNLYAHARIRELL